MVNPAQTGVDFINELHYTEEYNAYTFRNFYNGGGVGIGDINNDDLPDLFFCGNLVPNRLYLNRGNWQFEDITEKAGVASPDVWSSGVSFVDINGDQLLDIYVCKSGKPGGNNRHNELFINNGDLTFSEKSAEYRLNDEGLSTHAAFFDYDKDGDLDCYLLNNSLRSVGGYDLIPDQRKIRDSLGRNKLYRNDGAFFTDVSEAAGIYGSSIGFGLGVTIGDVNRDGWPDIFVSNDFFERDYLYINQQDGTFREELEIQIRETSLSSMGADMADINNDGFPEIFVTDMLPEKENRIKTKTTFENWDKYQLTLQKGYHHQFTRNVLQLNNGDGSFSEISRMAGVHATDWSWGALIFDFENDGYKDIFVANGIFKDLTDQDYINYYSDPNVIRRMIKEEGEVITKLIDAMPSEQLANYAFVNQGNLQFENQAGQLGLGLPGHSNGSAYGDLDNDGDLDLVINNINAPASIYRNNEKKNAFLSLKLIGAGKNTHALGTQVTVYSNNQEFYQEVAPMRGFQSCVDDRLLFGLGKTTMIDSVIILWPDLRQTILRSVSVNQFLTIEQKEALPRKMPAADSQSILQATGNLTGAAPHQENNFVDFDRDQLLFRMLSTEGPKIAQADVNQDGLTDLFLCGAKDQPGQLLLQTARGTFESVLDPFINDRAAEDTDCRFFDADNDGDADLYVSSGGNEYNGKSPALSDRLYLNDGQGGFEKSAQKLPQTSNSCIATADFDQDGDIDIFVGARLKPFLYGFPADGTLLINDGKANFTDATSEKAPELSKIGLITDAEWLDYDGDQDMDLILVGEWMPLTIFENQDGQLKRLARPELEYTAGFWTCLASADFNEDGAPDLILGNQGLNSRIKASRTEPVELYINDFDNNGMFEQILCTYNEGTSYPFVLRHDLVKQLPGLKKKFLKYEDYQLQQMTDIFPSEILKRSRVLRAYELESQVAINDGKGHFKMQKLPLAAQQSTWYGILVEDLNGDGHQDLLLGGNLYGIKPELGINDGSYGVFLQGDGQGGFEEVPQRLSGFKVSGQIRDILTVPIAGEQRILVALNNDSIKVFTRVQ